MGVGADDEQICPVTLASTLAGKPAMAPLGASEARFSPSSVYPCPAMVMVLLSLTPTRTHAHGSRCSCNLKAAFLTNGSDCDMGDAPIAVRQCARGE